MQSQSLFKKTIPHSLKYFALCATALYLTGCGEKNAETEVSSPKSQETTAEQKPKNSGKTKAETLLQLYSFEEASTPGSVGIINGKGELIKTPEGVTDGTQALNVKLDSKKHNYSSILFKPQTPWDWSAYSDFSIAFDIGNLGERSVQLFLNVSDASGKGYTRSVNVNTGKAKTYYSKMNGHDLGSPEGDSAVELNLSSGLRSNPATWNTDDIQFIWMWGAKHLDLSAITQVSLSVQNVLIDRQFTVDNVRLIKHPPQNPDYLKHIVDKYGQATRLDFEDKIHSDEELIAARDKELKELQGGKLLDDRSKFSGWKNGPKLKATGYYRTEKVDGKWSLVDPEGYLYFATGIDIIRLANASTMTGYDFDHDLIGHRDKDDTTPEDSKGPRLISKKAQATRVVASDTRKDMFEWLPSYDDPLADHYTYNMDAHSGALKRGEAFSFYSANLERKYGETTPRSYLKDWREVTINRMRSWGFTSFGNWTDPMYYDNQRMPFFANGWIIGDYKTVSSGNDFWGGLPDVFDPLFAERADVTLKQVAKEIQKTPWCVGIFIDNEKSWGRSETIHSQLGIVINTLTRDGKDVPLKNKFTDMMKAKYGDIAKLNKAWGKDVASWTGFQKGIESKIDESNKTQISDYEDLLYTYAAEYFRIVSEASKKYMPNHLYLGARFADWGMPMPVVKASAKYSDVVSYNYYKEGLITSKWKFLKELDKPSIIGEFHMGTTSSGFFHPGLIHAADQYDRARLYKEYMQSFIDNPYFIGVHWFQYGDSPITGRSYDGENYNVGFVSVADIPYAPMIKAARELHGELYTRRYPELAK